MYDSDCLHTPYLPPPSGSSTFRGNINGSTSSPSIKPTYREPIVPEGDLLNLEPSNTEEGIISIGGKDKKKRKTGFSKGPGGGGNRKRTDSGDSQREDSTVVSTSTNEDSMTKNDEDDSDDEWEEEEWVPDVFLFEYGTVVIWGMTEKEEKSFLRSLYVIFQNGTVVFTC